MAGEAEGGQEPEQQEFKQECCVLRWPKVYCTTAARVSVFKYTYFISLNHKIEKHLALWITNCG